MTETSPPPGASAGREERGETTMTVTTKPGVLLDVETYNRLHHAAQRENEACWVTSALRYCLALLRECPADHPSRPLVDEYVQLVVGEPRHWFDPSRLAADLRIARDVDAKMRAQGEDPTEADLESATKKQFRGLLGEVAELRSALAAERAAVEALETTIRAALYAMSRRLEGASVEDSYVKAYSILFATCNRLDVEAGSQPESENVPRKS